MAAREESAAATVLRVAAQPPDSDSPAMSAAAIPLAIRVGNRETFSLRSLTEEPRHHVPMTLDHGLPLQLERRRHEAVRREGSAGVQAKIRARGLGLTPEGVGGGGQSEA